LFTHPFAVGWLFALRSLPPALFTTFWRDHGASSFPRLYVCFGLVYGLSSPVFPVLLRRFGWFPAARFRVRLTYLFPRSLRLYRSCGLVWLLFVHVCPWCRFNARFAFERTCVINAIMAHAFVNDARGGDIAPGISMGIAHRSRERLVLWFDRFAFAFRLSFTSFGAARHGTLTSRRV